MYKSRNTAKIAVVAISVVLVAVGSYSLISSNINLPSMLPEEKQTEDYIIGSHCFSVK